MLKMMLGGLFQTLYKVELRGMENYHNAGDRVLIVANHTSFLDALLLGVYLPDELTFAINTHIAERLWVKPFTKLAGVFPMDPTNPLALKALIKFLKEDRKAVIFPEGRITVTGSLMKIYDGPGMIADKAQVKVLPIRIDGAQYTPFSRLRGRVRLRWSPRISINILPAASIIPPPEVRGRERRRYAGRMLTDLMTEMMFATSNHPQTLFSALLDARRIHGGRHRVLEDTNRKSLSYNGLISQSLAIGVALKELAVKGEYVGVLLPNIATTVAVMLGLQAYGRVPAMLNYTVGAKGMVSACQLAQIKTVLTVRRFIEVGKLEAAIERLEQHAKVIYLEDLAAKISAFDKIRAFIRAHAASVWYANKVTDPKAPAVVLFTSGSEGHPKGVVLSHANIIANRAQLAAKVPFGAQDIILNALPMFHSFGLTAGTMLPLLSGMRTFLYPSPLHYRIVPEIAYDINATIIFGTNTFLAGYARFAHPYDFYSIRYVFAGAEKLQEETRRIWISRFGIRIFEGYGATETSPVLAANTPMFYLDNSVGRLLPGIEYRLEKVPGVDTGGRLHVRGPNVMLGYLLHDNPGVLSPPVSTFGEGWYDTGDIVDVDSQGFVTILGRAKRFAKIGGEMVSLTAAEELVSTVWPQSQHAIVALPDAVKGEQLVLLTECCNTDRSELTAHAKQNGNSELTLPKKIIQTNSIPLMGTGKVDYPAVTAHVKEELGL